MEAKEIAKRTAEGIVGEAVGDWVDDSLAKLAQAYLDLLAKQEGHKLVPLEPSDERQKAFAKVWFKSGWAHWSTNLPVDKERFNAAYKAMLGVSDE